MSSCAILHAAWEPTIQPDAIRNFLEAQQVKGELRGESVTLSPAKAQHSIEKAGPIRHIRLLRAFYLP
jgi:hypothetical protein